MHLPFEDDEKMVSGIVRIFNALEEYMPGLSKGGYLNDERFRLKHRLPSFTEIR